MPSDLNGKDTVPTLRQLRLGRALLFLLFIFAIFTFPEYPTLDLDPSMRMALGWCFDKGMQFGRDVVFTYGPLGFLMGNTYFGLHFWSFILWELFLAFIFSAVILYNAERLHPASRTVYLIFFFLLGVAFQDPLQTIMIALLSFELVRRADRPWQRTTTVIVLFLTLISLVKFTYFVLATFGILTVCAYQLSIRRYRDALRLIGWFIAGYLTFWIICRQNPLNLPAYVYNSLQISQGYQEAVGRPTPPGQLWKAITALVLIGIYVLLYSVLERNKPRSLAFAAILSVFIYLQWKHGFVRADNHVVGFFICALLPVIAFPSLLDEGNSLRWLKRLLLFPVAVLCLWGIHDKVPSFSDYVFQHFYTKLWNNVYNTAHWSSYRRSFDERLETERAQFGLTHTRAEVGNSTVDVLGFDQAIALYNGLNYRPRPVFQSYSTFTPHLARLNYDYYMSDRAPDYVLFKMQTIDNRWPTLDDGPVLGLLMYRYRYIHTEMGYHLWKRRDSKPDVSFLTNREVRTDVAPLNIPVTLKNLSEKQLWATIDIRPSLFGRLRSFFYKPAFVNLVIKDTASRRSVFRLTPPQAKTGFILNPMIEDTSAYLQLATNESGRRLRSLQIQVADDDKHFFAGTAQLELFELPAVPASTEYSQQLNKARFWMFSSYPITARSAQTPREIKLDGRNAILMHAPSQMEFEVPAGALEVSGGFGFVPGAYQNGGRTKGAEFSVVWTNGQERTEIYKRFLNPVEVETDRGLQDFRVGLRGITGGRLLFQTSPGPSKDASWGWTFWTGIAITGPPTAPKND
jgi:hypothetical protein